MHLHFGLQHLCLHKATPLNDSYILQPDDSKENAKMRVFITQADGQANETVCSLVAVRILACTCMSYNGLCATVAETSPKTSNTILTINFSLMHIA